MRVTWWPWAARPPASQRTWSRPPRLDDGTVAVGAAISATRNAWVVAGAGGAGAVVGVVMRSRLLGTCGLRTCLQRGGHLGSSARRSVVVLSGRAGRWRIARLAQQPVDGCLWVAVVAAKRAQRRQAPLPPPAGHRAWVHPQPPSDLAGAQQPAWLLGHLPAAACQQGVDARLGEAALRDDMRQQASSSPAQHRPAMHPKQRYDLPGAQPRLALGRVRLVVGVAVLEGCLPGCGVHRASSDAWGGWRWCLGRGQPPSDGVAGGRGAGRPRRRWGQSLVGRTALPTTSSSSGATRGERRRSRTPARDAGGGWGRAGGEIGGGLRSPPRRQPPAPPRPPARSCRDLDACPCTPNTATTPFRRHRPLPSGRLCLFGLVGRLVFGAALRVVA